MDNYWKGCPPKMSDGRFLQDFRSADRREQYIKYVNNIVRDDEQRMLYQKYGSDIMDREWNLLKQTQSCFTNCCIHNYPTRTSPGTNYEELKIYNAVKTNKLKKTDKMYPLCKNLPDYRMS